MKKFAWILGTILLALTLVVVGCTRKAPETAPAPQPSAPSRITTETGTLGEVDVQKSTVTIETGKGEQTFQFAPGAQLTIEGQACTLEQLEELLASGNTYDCTVTYDELGRVTALDVSPRPAPAAITGTISDVNIAESTITVKTAEGDKVFQVDQNTGLLIGGTACSLELLDALEAAGSLAGQECTVIYTTDKEGKALYISIESPPNLTQGTGTISKVDVKTSTVTIMTDKGEKTYTIDANTGAFLGGEVCSIDDIEESMEHGDFLKSCEVLYYTDSAGKLIYIDITRKP